MVRRTITALLAIPLVLSLIYHGSERHFFIIVFITAGLSSYEYFKMSFSSHRIFMRSLSLFSGLLCMLLIDHYQIHLSFNYRVARISPLPLCYAAATLTIFIVSLKHLMQFPRQGRMRRDLSVVLFGTGYVTLLLSYLLFIRSQPGGVEWLFFMLFVLWAGDSCAYFVGTLIGRHKLLPEISPNKTLEGAVGGLAGSLLAGFFSRTIFMSELSAAHCFALSLALALAGQIGDLCESTLKRNAGFKDSGNLLPGHGGILDRIDSLLFAAPVLYHYKVLLL